MPVNVFHRKYTASTAGPGAVTWRLDSPGMDLLLDSEAYVEYRVTINGVPPGNLAGQFEGSAAVVGNLIGNVAQGDTSGVGGPVNQLRYALRQGFCMNNALSHVELKLNESQDSVNPSVWNGAFTRYYATTEEIDSICTMSGGPLDSGNHSRFVTSDATFDTDTSNLGNLVGNAPTRFAIQHAFEPTRVKTIAGLTTESTVNMRSSFPLTGEFHNPGLTERWHAMAVEQRRSAQADAAQAAGGSRYFEPITLTITERIPIDPFLQWERKDGRKKIPWVRRMELAYSFHGNAVELIVQGVDTAQRGISVDWWTTKPVLHLKWITPPAVTTPRQPLVIPYTFMTERVLGQAVIELANAVHSTPPVAVTFSNIRIEQPPDMMFLFWKARIGDQSMSWATEKHLEITNLKMSFNTAKGSLFDASSQELFAMYVRNSPVSATRRFRYHDWQRRYCTVVLRPEDYGIQYKEPGGVTIDLTTSYSSHWNHASVGRRPVENEDVNPTTYELHLVMLHERGMLMHRDNSHIAKLSEFGV